jgi:putative ABC transport system permease protein
VRIQTEYGFSMKGPAQMARFEEVSGELVRAIPESTAPSYVLLPYRIQLLPGNSLMISSYIKIAFRNLWRNKLYALINIFGLSVAIGCCIVAYLNFQYYHDFDAFHKNADSIYRVETIRTVNARDGVWGIVPLPLGPALKKDFPSVVDAVRFAGVVVVVRSGEKVFNELVRYADDGFFDLFTFPLQSGAKDVLKDKGEAVLASQCAIKYFGDENPIGRQLILQYDNGEKQIVTVGAVAKKIPGNSSIDFDILVPIRKLVEAHIDDPGNWSRWTSALFVQMRSPDDIALLQKANDRYVAMQNAANPKNPVSSFSYEPLRRIVETSRTVRSNTLQIGAPPSSVGGPIIMAVLLLLMACFNYVNTSIAFSFNRMKEIGLRKVIGGNRMQLVRQFLGENFVVVTISLIASLGIAEFLVPGFRNLFPFVEIELDYLRNVRLILFLGGLLLVTAFLAGAYPAYYITAYKPAALLRGTQKLGKSTILMRSLLAVQFALSMVAVGTGIIFADNARYQEKMDIGYQMDRLAFVPVTNRSQYTVYRDALQRNEMVKRVAGSKEHVYFGWTRKVIQSEGKPLEVQLFSVGFGYMETVGFRLKEGRLFDPGKPSDQVSSAIVSQKAVEEYGWREPLGKTVEVDSARYTVIGVVEDFYNRGVWHPIAPALFRMADESSFRFLVARLSQPISSLTTTMLRQTWKDHFPDAPYEGLYQDFAMKAGISVSHSATTVFAVIGAVALIISTMGLFALVSLRIARRTKEIGVRKVLGAGVASLLQLLNREMVVVLLLSAAAADVIGYFAAQSLLGSIYAYHSPVSVGALVIADWIVVLVGIATAMAQTIRVATANPVEALRYE